MSMLTGENLSIGYNGKEILKNISFEIKCGDYLCVLGENGAGKSTLIKTILGLLPPIKGNIEYGDGLKQNEIGYLPQQTIVQKDFPASVEEIVISGFQGHMGLRPFYTKKEKQLAVDNMKKMNIESLSKKSYRELSGGQQQRVLLARALCATKKVLLLDEPVAGLDPVAMSSLYDLTKMLNDEGVTIIMISHDISFSLKHASHILHLSNKPFFATKKDYLNSNIGKKFLMLNEEEATING